MNNISKAIQEARPPLSQAAPLTYAICWGFAVVNVVLGLGMIFLYQTSVPIAVASILPYWGWGIVFLILSSTTTYGLIKNNWNLTKRSQLAGVIVKSVWLTALIIRSFDAPQTILITGVWVFFAWVQVVTYVHFVPSTTTEDRGDGNV